MTTVKIKPSHKSQGDFVVIDKADFDAAKHELLDAEAKTAKPRKTDKADFDAKPE